MLMNFALPVNGSSKTTDASVFDSQPSFTVEPPYTDLYARVVWEGSSAMGSPVPMCAGFAQLLVGASVVSRSFVNTKENERKDGGIQEIGSAPGWMVARVAGR